MIVASSSLVAFSDNNASEPAPTVAAPEVKYPWESHADAGLTITSGNKDTVLGTIALGTARKTPKNEYTFEADGGYGKADDTVNQNYLHGVGQWNHLFSERAFSYVHVEGMHDEVASIDYRLSISPGAGYYLLKETNTTLAVEVGPGFVSQRLGGETKNYATLRLAERFEHKFSANTRVWQSAELLPQVDRWQNCIVNAELGAEASMTSNLSLRVVLSDTYNTEPAFNRKRNDIKLVSSLSYKF